MKHIALITLLLITILGSAQDVNWMTIEEAYAESKTEAKPILVDVYTDWCGWCKRMDKDTYSKEDIANYINSNFLPVKFNAEQKDSINILNHTFKFVDQGRRGYHELAAALLNGKMSYPATVFLNEKFEMITVVPGYQNQEQFDVILNYIEGEHYMKTPFEEFSAAYGKN
jgi:thioredoxin-related protein